MWGLQTSEVCVSEKQTAWSNVVRRAGLPKSKGHCSEEKQNCVWKGSQMCLCLQKKQKVALVLGTPLRKARIDVEKPGFRTAWLITSQKFPWKILDSGSWIQLVEIYLPKYFKYAWEWLDEEIWKSVSFPNPMLLRDFEKLGPDMLPNIWSLHKKRNALSVHS